MIDLLDMFDSSLKLSAVRLADTLHNLRILDNEEFDMLIEQIYEKYGEEFDGNFIDNDYL